MNVCGFSTATRGPPGPVRPSVSSPANFHFGFGRSQRAINADAEIERRPHVETTELGHQEHVRGPFADAAYQDEFAYDLIVG